MEAIGTNKAGHAAVDSGETPVAVVEIMEIRRLLDDGSSRDALARAKRLWKRGSTDAAEAVLIDAYVARIESLLGRGLRPEASSLLEVLLHGHRPFESPRWLDVARLSALSGDVTPLVAPLADADLPDQERRRIEGAVARDVTDPGVLAECAALPLDHPLRVAARAVVEAFAAVTSGPVDPGAFVLPEVSRRSPLAGWKLLCRAIAAAYRGDRSECERCVAAIDPAAAPAHLIPAVWAVVDASPGGREPGEAVRALAARLRPRVDRLRGQLERLDHCIRAAHPRGVANQVREVMRLVDRLRPDLRPPLQHRVSVLALMNGVPAGPLRGAFGRPALRDAAFWRLLARGLERVSHPMHASGAWAVFARHAVAQGLFAANGVEAAALFLHMAEVLESLPAEEMDEARELFLDDFEGFAPMYEGQPKAVRRLAPSRGERPDHGDLRPEDLYRRAAAIVPQRVIFTRWLDWTSGLPPADPRRREALEACHRALPEDLRTILELILVERRRGAFRKALAFVDKAETIDPANAQVRCARLRLLVDAAARHLRTRKPILLETDLVELASLPGSDEPERAALLAAVRSLGRLAQGDREEAIASLRDASSRLGSSSVASILLLTVARDAGLRNEAAELAGAVEAAEPPNAGRLVTGVARVCRVADDATLYLEFPPAVVAALIRALDDASTSLDAGAALRIAEHAHRSATDDRLAYAAAGAGLRRSDEAPAVGRLLVARARAIADDQRAASCLLAAVTIARRHRDGATAADALRAYEALVPPWAIDDEAWRAGLDDEEVDAVVEFERRPNRLGERGPGSRNRRRNRRDRRKPSPEPSEVVFEPSTDRPFSDAPRELEDLMMEVLAKYGGLPDADELLRKDPELAARLFEAADLAGFIDGPGATGSPRRRRGRKPGKGRKRRR